MIEAKKFLERLNKLQKETLSSSTRDHPKRKLHEISTFFISKSWDAIESDLLTSNNFGIVLEEAHTHDYFAEIYNRDPNFPWGWFRARAEEALFHRLLSTLPEIFNTHTEETKIYKQYLKKTGHYWFRQTPTHHLKLGYHTAISAIWKMLGGGAELYLDKIKVPKDSDILLDHAKSLSTFHLEMLLASDGVLWDGAGAFPLPAKLSDDTITFTEDSFEIISKKFPITNEMLSEPRLGCPAHRAMSGNGVSVFSGVNQWCKKIFLEVYIPVMNDIWNKN